MTKKTDKIKKIILAYSGGLDTSVILKWLKQTYKCDIITLTCDLGQEEDLAGVDQKALDTGASKAYVEDLRNEFAKDFIFPMMRSSVVYEGSYLLGTSIARPLISKRLVEIARSEGADAISHGATGKGNDQVRFELSVASLAPDLQVIAPWRTWELSSRTDLIKFAEKNNIPLPTGSKRYSMDRNMLHLSYESGELEDPWEEAGEGTYTLTTPIEKTPNEPEYITIEFKNGDPIAINEKEYAPAALVMNLNKIAGKHGIGRIDMVENRFVGMKSRGVYETPGGTLIHAAHRDLESICLDREVMHIRDSLIPRYAACIYNGFWYSPEREVLQALIDKSQENISGTVRLKLFKGNVFCVGRKSPNSLFRKDIATFEHDDVYNQAMATGFIQLNGLRIQGHNKI
ncbi:argininosuccinate synthase [Desulfovibrio litoralis]|uniref:Argininosuccinate synthase n=1 Tax=Desulfovibrio litoralis DSM 11393 TaxID=1121455 RepID=A0A1M7SG40_9BACT|nr:argininosuccinate synthase [Desulfovibrio litoralis]SHN57435.1 argininosuccinate synthase [Desulfovibrio litoralis DSM 11393]